MCDIKNGHDYSKDARREMSVPWNGDGHSWWVGMGDWLRANWLVLTVAALVLGWVIRVEVFAQAGPRFTPRDAREMEIRWEERFDSLPPAAYVKYVDSRFDSVEKQLDLIYQDTSWIKSNLSP